MAEDHYRLERALIVGHVSLVGSRETPEDIISLMELTGELLCTLGYRGRSGLAGGADQAFYRGAQRSPRFLEVGFENYLPNDWMMGKPDLEKRIYDATTLVGYERATELAFEARGSFEGLKRGGMQLQIRNVYQVLGKNLNMPSKFLVCWAKPVGRKGLVKGGTNTAVQLAHRFKIPVINMATEEGMTRVQAFIEKQKATQA